MKKIDVGEGQWGGGYEDKKDRNPVLIAPLNPGQGQLHSYGKSNGCWKVP